MNKGRCYDGPWHDRWYESWEPLVRVPAGRSLCEMKEQAARDLAHTLRIHPGELAVGIYAWTPSLRLWIWLPPGA
jgi:hypothetical protein